MKEFRNQWITAVVSRPGGCQKEEEPKEPHDNDGGEEEVDVDVDVEMEVEEEQVQESVDNLAAAAIISEDPHTVLVEFSSVVADTQEYIIGVSSVPWPWWGHGFLHLAKPDIYVNPIFTLT